MPVERPSRRTLLRTGAWSVPLIVTAAAAPALAASTPGPRPKLGAQVSDPTDFGGTTGYVIRVTNQGAAPITTGGLVALLPDTPGTFYSGFSGDVRWRYGSGSEVLSFVYSDVLAAGDQAGPLLVIIGRQDPSTTPVATLILSAPGYEDTVLQLPIIY